MACCQVSRWANSLGLLSALWPRRRTRQQVRSTIIVRATIPRRINRSTIPASSSLPKLWTEEDNYKVNFLFVHSKAAVIIQEANQISTSNAIYPTVLLTLSNNWQYNLKRPPSFNIKPKALTKRTKAPSRNSELSIRAQKILPCPLQAQRTTLRGKQSSL